MITTHKPQKHQRFSIRWEMTEAVRTPAEIQKIREDLANDIANFEGEIQVIPGMPEVAKPRPHREPENCSNPKALPRMYMAAPEAARTLGLKRTRFLKIVEEGKYPAPSEFMVNGKPIEAWKRSDIKHLLRLKNGRAAAPSSAANDQYIINHYATATPKEIATALGLTNRQVIERASELRDSGRLQILAAQRPTPRSWTKDELDWLIENIDELGVKLTAKHLNRSASGIRAKVQALRMEGQIVSPSMEKVES